MDCADCDRLHRAQPPCGGWTPGGDRPAPCGNLREPGLSGYEAELAETWQMLSFYGREFGLMGGVGPLRIEAVLALLDAKGFGDEELRLVLMLDQIIYPSLVKEEGGDGA